jgi:type IV pilus assembly protein PilC
MFKKISNKEFFEFNRVFGLLLYSRVSIINSLELILKQTKKKNFESVLKNIVKEVKSGHTLSKSFSKYPDIFSEIYISNLKVAEETGAIAEVISEYTDYLEKMESLKKKILQAVRYPILVLMVASGVVFFMLTFLIPTFESLFTSMKGKLPVITKTLITISNLFVNNSIYLLVGFILIALLIAAISKSQYFKQLLLDNVICKIPVVTKLYTNNLLARFCLSMGILLKSRVSIVDALKISKNVTKNITFRKQIDLILKKIIKGETIAANVGKSRFFDVTFTRMLAAGEESAELDKVFYLMSNYYNSEFDNSIDNITSLLEPALILIVGIIVGIILIGLYLPMFDIVNYMGN